MVSKVLPIRLENGTKGFGAFSCALGCLYFDQRCRCALEMYPDSQQLYDSTAQVAIPLRVVLNLIFSPKAEFRARQKALT